MNQSYKKIWQSTKIGPHFNDLTLYISILYNHPVAPQGPLIGQ